MVSETPRDKRTLHITRMWDQSIPVSNEAGPGSQNQVKAVACDERTIRQLEEALNAAKQRLEYVRQHNLQGGEHGKRYVPKMQLWPHEPGTSNLKVYFPAIPEHVTSPSED